jgi:hypothetical protein
MAIGSTALANFLVILVIGIVAGLTFNRYARSWLTRLGTTTRSDITAALVGIAGAFIGFHISIILGLLPRRSCTSSWRLSVPLRFYGCGEDGELVDGFSGARSGLAHARVWGRQIRSATLRPCLHIDHSDIVLFCPAL